ncbi:MAG: hypothetical protein ABIS59_01775, partial [Candidatus Saccharibacteria bacterium]
MKILEANIIDWINIESRRSLKQGQRFNFHFDPRVSPEQMISKIIDIHNNGNRSFLPFIRRQDRQRKFRYHSKEGIAALDSEMPPKPIISHKIRPIMYASNTDALIYSFYSTLIGSKYEDF